MIGKKLCGRIEDRRVGFEHPVLLLNTCLEAGGDLVESADDRFLLRTVLGDPGFKCFDELSLHLRFSCFQLHSQRRNVGQAFV